MWRLVRSTFTTPTLGAGSNLRRTRGIPEDRDRRREGVVLGLIVATGIWVWLAVVDAFAGEPFRTANLFGGIAAFTLVHYLLNIVYGIVLVSVVRGTRREPSLAIAGAFALVTIEIAFAMVTVLLSHLGLGQLAWIRIFGGSVLGVALAIAVLSRRHPLAAQLRYADERPTER